MATVDFRNLSLSVTKYMGKCKGHGLMFKLAFHVRVLRYPYSVLRFNQVYTKLVKVFPCVRIAYTVNNPYTNRS